MASIKRYMTSVLASERDRELPYPAFDKLCSRCLDFTKADYVKVEVPPVGPYYFLVDNRRDQSLAETTFRAKWPRHRILQSIGIRHSALGSMNVHLDAFSPKADERVWIHDNWEQMSGRAATRECHLCFVLASSIDDCLPDQSPSPFVESSRRPGKQTIVVLVPVRFFDALRLVVWISDLEAQDTCSQKAIELQPFGRPARFAREGLPLVRNSKFDPNGPRSNGMLFSTAEFLKSSLSTCITDHKECVKQRECATGAWPSRLLYVDGTPANIRLRLVEVAHLACDQWLLGYVTLSHCWGSQGIVSKLTRANYAASMGNISTGALPKTFHDAAVITLALGQQYLWIDALCIIQDSREDWLHEAPLMGHIYASALINLAATASEDGQGGLLVQDYLKSTCRVRIRQGELKGVYDVSPVPRVKDSDGFDAPEIRGMDQSPLQRRAWVFQETVLSTRIAYFTDRQVNYQCYESFLRESHKNQIAIASGQDDDVYPAVRKMFDRNRWETLVNLYAKCELSFATDRLPAFAGIAQAYAEKNHYSFRDYLAGLWRQQIWHHLIWELPPRSVRASPPENEKYPLGPTWSWASWDFSRSTDYTVGPYRHRDNGDIKFNATLELIHTDIVPEGNSYFGALRHARLRIKTVVIQARWPLDHESDQHMTILDSQDGSYRLLSNWDRANFSSHHREVYVLPIKRNKILRYEGSSINQGSEVMFLAMTPVENQPGTFRRCGTMDIRLWDSSIEDPLPDWWVKGSDLDEALHVEHRGLGQYVIDLI